MVTPSNTRICESAEVTSTSEGFPGANYNHRNVFFYFIKYKSITTYIDASPVSMCF
jgi:hypothetical protein